MDERREVFWPISRHLLNDVGERPDGAIRVRALTAYQLLFAGRLVIRDSDYVNCGVFRRALQAVASGHGDETDKFFSELFQQGLILVLRRDSAELVEVIHDLSGSVWANAQPWFAPTSDLALLDNPRLRDRTPTFAVADAAAYYTKELLALLSRPLEPHLPDGLRLRLLDRALQIQEMAGTLRWANFYPDGEIWAGIDPAVRDAAYPFAYQVLGQAPHAGFVPHHLSIDPVFMDDVADAIALWRGRLDATREQIEHQTTELGAGQFSFSDYASCLAALPARDVIELGVCPEAQMFHLACQRFMTGGAQLDDVVRGLRAYRRRIDRRILEHRVAPPTGGREAVAAFVRHGVGEARDELIDLTFDTVQAKIPGWKLGLSLLHVVKTGELPGATEKRQARTSGALAAGQLVADLQADGERFRTRLIRSPEGLDRHVTEAARRDVLISPLPSHRHVTAA